MNIARKPTVVNDRNPLIDTDIDFDAPYVDFERIDSTMAPDIGKNGVRDSLFYEDTKIFTVDEVTDVEVRFYSTETPNENYRIGQRHIRGRVLDIEKYDANGFNPGYKIRFDASKEYYGKTTTLGIDNDYINVTHARCIAIIYHDEVGHTIRELILPIDDWFSDKVYIVSGFVVDDPEPYPFLVGDIVDFKVYFAEKNEKQEITGFTEETFAGRIKDISLVQRKYTTTDEDDVVKENTVQYYKLEMDISTEYNYRVLTIASNVISYMKLKELPD